MSVLILDTSALVKIKSLKNASNQISVLLTKSKASSFFISEISHYELLRGCDSQKNFEQSQKIISAYRQIKTDTDVILFATNYYNVIMKFLSGEEKKKIAFPNQLSDCDVFIGATAMSFNAFLCTTDRNDFPSPFFDEHLSTKLDSGDKAYILKPDVNLYDSELKKLMGRIKPPAKKYS